jgi:SpoIID/LytB domain protein
VTAIVLSAVATSAPAGATVFDLDQLHTLWALPIPKIKKNAKGEDLVRVRIYPHGFKDAAKRAAEPLDKVTLEGVCQPFTGKADEAASGGKKLGKVAAGKNIKLNFTIKNLKQPLWLECAGPVTVYRGQPLTSHKYEASFYVRKVATSDVAKTPHVEVIAVLPIESYLRGVVPTEVIPSWPVESLKAQTLAARSYVHFNISHNEHFPNPKIFDVDDTNHYQAFSGLTNIHANTDAAIKATAGEIMTYKKMVFPAFFDTDHGGHLESAKEVFNLPAPYCAVKPDAKEVEAAVKPWTVTMKLADLAKALPGIIPSGKTIKGLSVAATDLTPGKRARFVTAKLSDNKTVKIPIADFRRAAGALTSSLFKLTVTGDSVTIDGKGRGHGVGLNQMGAKELAKAGWDYKKILNFYFSGIKICTGKACQS